MKVREWAFDRMKDAFEKVAQDEAEKVSIVQEIMLSSTDCLRRIIAARSRTRRRYSVPLVPRMATVSRWKTTFGGSLGE